MPRLPRIYIANCLYYITAHGVVGENIFIDEKDYAMYLELLKKYKQQYGLKLFAFALMPDSLNLVVELKEAEALSRIMHDLTANYTKYFNNRYVRKGHLFRERFKSVVVEKGPYLLQMVRYTHATPVRRGLAQTPSGYAFSSELIYAHHNDPQGRGISSGPLALLVTDVGQEIREALDIFAKNYPDKKDYAERMASVTEKELDELSKKLSRAGSLGSQEFVESIQEQLKKKELEEQEEAKKDFIHPVISISVVVVLAGTLAVMLYAQRPKKEMIPPQAPEAPVAPARNEPMLRDNLENLDGTEWIVELKSEGNAGSATLPNYDRLVFKKGTVSLQYLSSKGFNTSNYNFARQEDGALVWETMQRNAQGDIVYLRGEEKDGNMKGTLRQRFVDGKNEGVLFKSPGYYRVKE